MRRRAGKKERKKERKERKEIELNVIIIYIFLIDIF